MASGTITLTRSGSGELYGQIQWSSVSNGTQANTSTVTATIQLKRPEGWYTQGTWKGSLKVGGTTKTISYHTTVRDEWLTIDTLTVTVSHNADGSGSCYIYGTLNGPTETSMEGTSVSGSSTVTLDTIPRFASIVSAPNFHDEENPVITYSNPAGSSVTTLQACISLDGSGDDVAYRSISKTGSSYTFSLTDAERNMLRAATTDGNTRTVRFYIRTTIGSSSGVSSLARTLTIKDPEPTITPTITDSNAATVALTGNSSKLIRYYSNAAVTIGAAAVKQASLIIQKVACGSKSLTSDGTISAVESGSFLFTATDSRGNTTTKTVAAPFVNYIKLTCSLSNEIPDASGNMTVKAAGNYFNGSFGSKSNSLKVYYRYKPYGGTYGGWTAMTVSLSGNTYTAAASVTGLNYQTAYVFQTYASDALATVYSGEKTVKATPVFDWGENDFNFNVPVTLGGGATAVKLTSADDLNNIKTNGFYWWSYSDKPANAPGAAYSTYMTAMRVWTSSGSVCCQEIVDMTDSVARGTKMQRTIYGNTAYEWEWVNPLMVVGYEYRTTERYLGKPVYAKIISVGTMPNAGTKNIEHGISDLGYIVQRSGTTVGTNIGYSFPIDYSANSVGKIEIYVNKGSIFLQATADWSSASCYVLLKYTKTTD